MRSGSTGTAVVRPSLTWDCDVGRGGGTTAAWPVHPAGTTAAGGTTCVGPVGGDTSWVGGAASPESAACRRAATTSVGPRRDRKSTRLNSSHVKISYAVFCLKKKN